jgi:lipopolysaccharide export system protein LptA
MPARRLPLTCLLALSLLGATAVRAELADRQQPIVVEADRPGTLDLQRQVVVFNGNVQIQQGTMTIRADRIEIREQPDGSRTAVAIGDAARPASYRQKREGLNETVEGSADRIEYDSRTGTLKLIGQGTVRRLRDGVVADEITGALITWDDSAELFSVQGSAPGAAASGGRVRAVLTPRAASAPAPGTRP